MLGDNGYVGGFACAAKCGKSIDAMEYHSDSGPSIALFSYLGLNFGDFLLTGKAPAPLERTYLTAVGRPGNAVSSPQNSTDSSGSNTNGFTCGACSFSAARKLSGVWSMTSKTP